MRRRGDDGSYSKYKYNKHRDGFGLQEAEKAKCPACGKICYTKKEAMTAVNFAKRRNEHHKIPVRCYYCEDCNYWHLTSQARKEDEHHVK